mgnify:CR=1 FL=1
MTGRLAGRVRSGGCDGGPVSEGISVGCFGFRRFVRVAVPDPLGELVVTFLLQGSVLAGSFVQRLSPFFLQPTFVLGFFGSPGSVFLGNFLSQTGKVVHCHRRRRNGQHCRRDKFAMLARFFDQLHPDTIVCAMADGGRGVDRKSEF